MSDPKKIRSDWKEFNFMLANMGKGWARSYGERANFDEDPDACNFWGEIERMFDQRARDVFWNGAGQIEPQVLDKWSPLPGCELDQGDDDAC